MVTDEYENEIEDAWVCFTDLDGEWNIDSTNTDGKAYCDYDISDTDDYITVTKMNFIPYQLYPGGTLDDDLLMQGDIAIAADLTVPSGKTLTIKRGSTVMLAPNVDLEVSGSLYAEGDADHRIKFTSVVIEPATQYYASGIDINLGTGVFDYCDFEYMYTAVECSINIRMSVTNCSIKDVSYTGVGLRSPRGGEYTTIQDNVIEDFATYGIGVYQEYTVNDPIIIDHNTIRRGEYGIYYLGKGKADITDNIISDTTGVLDYGIWAGSNDNGRPTLTITGNNIQDATVGGMWVYDINSTSTIINNDITGNNNGLGISSCSPDLECNNSTYNFIEGNSNYGVYITFSSSPTFRHNMILRNGSTNDAAVFITMTGVNDADFGIDNDGGYNAIYFDDDCDGTLDPIPNGYKFLNNQQTLLTVDAVKNYWGPGDPSSYIVNADYDSALNSNPFGDCAYTKQGAEANLPRVTQLYQNYPNPFNPNTLIKFYLQKESPVTINIYNVLGKKVAEFNYNNLSDGEHLIQWDGKNKDGLDVASGIYFYVLKTSDKRISKKMTLIR